MGMGSFTTKMVECTMGTGVTTKWMDLDLFTTNQENQHTKVCGDKTSSKAKANYLMNIHMHQISLSIMQTSIKSISFGRITKVTLMIAVGDFVEDFKKGKGKLMLSNGQYFEGTFNNDMVEGPGTFHRKNGQVIKGVWRQNHLVSQ